MIIPPVLLFLKAVYHGKGVKNGTKQSAHMQIFARSILGNNRREGGTPLKQQILRKAEKIRSRSLRATNPKIDLLRSYGILCIVYAHCMGHGLRLFGVLPVSSVYVIHLFIFCAGYFYKPEQDQAAAIPYLRGRVRAYLLPYFIWNLIYGIVGMILRALGVIYYGEPVTLYSLFIAPWVNADQYYFNYPSWFLLSLFLVVLVTWGLRWLISKRHRIGTLEDHLLLGVFLLAAVLAVYVLGQETEHLEPKIAWLRPLVLLPFYQLGYVYRNYWEEKLRKWRWGLILLLAQSVLSLGNWMLTGKTFATKMVYGYYVGNPLLLVLTAACMVLLLAFVAEKLSTLVHGKRLGYFSHCTMYIMLHHLFILFLTQAGLWVMDHLVGLPGFSSDRFHGSIWYVYAPWGSGGILVYVAICLVIPAGLHWLYENCILQAAKKLNL
jgi:F0F1-type ATP synthase assembly protein I